MKKLERVIEAMLYLSGTPLAIKEIAEKLEITEAEVSSAANELKKDYSGDRGINLRIFNKKLQFVSNPVYAETVSLVLNPVKERELSNSMLETIAIIAYKQPITRLEIEEIRGVNSDYALQVLSKNNLIEVVGRKDAIGKPVLFGTTDNFLKRFRLESIDQLPDMQSLLDRIIVVNNEESSSELYHRDEYAEHQIDINDDSIGLAFEAEMREQIDGEAEKKAERAAGRGGDTPSEVEESVQISVEDEELPDFLADEPNVMIIKSE